MADVGGANASCGECSTVVTEKGLQCEVCLTWFHLSPCTAVPEALYKAISKHPTVKSLKWFCKKCEEKVGNMLTGLIGIIERQDKADKELLVLKKELAQLGNAMLAEKNASKEGQEMLHAEVEGVKKEVGIVGKDLSEQKLKYSDVAKTGLIFDKNSEVKGLSGLDQNKVLQAQINEAVDRDARKNNLVFMGIDESLNEQETKDFIEEIFSKLMVNEKTKYELKGRIGRLSDKCRPVKVLIEDNSYRRNLLKKAFTLKTDTKFNKIFIAPDLTIQQQKDDKTLRDKVKELRSQGATGIKINRGCVVKMEGTTREVLFEVPLSI